jgi:hypothetical protein
MLALATPLTLVSVSAANSLTAQQAAAHIGETATVCGLVVSATYATRTKGQPTFLNFDCAYPNQVFTVMIWGGDRPKFGTPEQTFMGKRLCATGIQSNCPRNEPHEFAPGVAPVGHQEDRSPLRGGHHRLWLNDGDGAPQRRKQPAQPHEEKPISCSQPRPRYLPAEHIQLMSQHCNLGFQPRLRAEGRRQCVKEQT